ncbi:hypothetical protein CEXT_462141 [Caerostris extrusa]|uniref:Uncharacterized protein n=1 Tax=Caerostris extrusa TaxID=172846 RepID=A0AAV4P6V9_CAEEX|nr:hypothetical protein CEXT_462141 [Caerostris extrusa]
MPQLEVGGGTRQRRSNRTGRTKRLLTSGVIHFPALIAPPGPPEYAKCIKKPAALVLQATVAYSGFPAIFHPSSEIINRLIQRC